LMCDEKTDVDCLVASATREFMIHVRYHIAMT